MTARSFTDPVTNATSLAGVQLQDHLDSYLGWGSAPRELVPTFLHEACHHWCFDSPVGTTLAFLHLRARRNAVALAHHSDEENLDEQILEDVVRYDTATAFLKPLAEGMALFLEFDAFTRPNSHTYSVPLAMASQFFAESTAADPKEEPPDRLITLLVANFLGPTRLSDGLLRRKVSVLGQPFTCQGEGYLPGYLLVRELWRFACIQDPRLLGETDLFLIYLRAFVYEDYGLVAALLTPETHELRSYEAVATRIAARLEAFLELAASDVARFESAAGIGDIATRETARRTALQVAPELYDSAHSLLDEVGRWYERQDLSEVDTSLQYHERAVLARRQVLYIGSCPAHITVGDGRYTVSTGGQTIRRGAARPGSPPGDGAGSIDILFWATEQAKVVAMRRGADLIAAESSRALADEKDDELTGLVADQDEARERARTLDQSLDLVLADSWIRIVIDTVRNFLPEKVDGYVLPLALSDSVPPQLELASAAMAERGFFPLLGYDRGLIEGLAYLGLCCSLAPDRPIVDSHFRARGLDLDATIEAADQLHDKYGVAKVVGNKRLLLPRV